jgi:predicted O-linked N-acetylglucosamine transferase (SPINDLY family)
MTAASLTGSPPSQLQISQLVAAFTNKPRAVFEVQAAAFDAAFPRDFTAQNLLGALYGNLKDFVRAEAAFGAALAAKPDHVDTLFVYGVTLRELGRHADAAAALSRVEALQPGNIEAAYQRALCLHELGQFKAAAQALKRISSAEPDNTSVLNNLGLALMQLGRHAEAAITFERAVARDPLYTEARANLALVLQETRQFARAEALLRAGIGIDAENAELHERLGSLLQLANDVAGAENAFRRALAIDPQRVESLNNLGLILHRTRRTDEALDCFARALREKPGMAALHSNIGFTLNETGALDEALAALTRALELDPDQPVVRAQKIIQQLQICDWTALEDYAAIADTLGLVGEPIPPGSLLAIDDDPARQRARAAAYAARFVGIVPSPFAPRVEGNEADGRIRIGYFSADFHDHATMFLMAGLFREHDRSRFEITAYSYGQTREGALRDHLIAHVDRFVDIADLPDLAVVDLARSHALDIAVDLKGYTQDNRIALFAHRLAPIQIGHVGYPGTSGAGFLDYIVADPQLIPAAERAHYSECVIRLPGTYQPSDDQRPIAPTLPGRAELGLPETGCVFACFNNAYKITPREFDIWMRLLDQVPGSVLWLFRANAWAEANLRRAAEARGIASERLVFAPRVEHAEHLARLRHADLFIDCFACNAHTTASDALWAGVPVLTRPGRSFIARVASSLNHAIGLPEMVAESDEAYAALALALAQDPARLAEIRARLAANRTATPLFDTKRYTRNLEAGFAAAYERHRAGLPPEDIAVPDCIPA